MHVVGRVVRVNISWDRPGIRVKALGVNSWMRKGIRNGARKTRTQMGEDSQGQIIFHLSLSLFPSLSSYRYAIFLCSSFHVYVYVV